MPHLEFSLRIYLLYILTVPPFFQLGMFDFQITSDFVTANLKCWPEGVKRLFVTLLVACLQGALPGKHNMSSYEIPYSQQVRHDPSQASHNSVDGSAELSTDLALISAIIQYIQVTSL